MTSHRIMAAVAAMALAALAAPSAGAATTEHREAGQDTATGQYYDSGLAPTPYMGWNTYYGLGAPTEAQVKNVADYLVSSGLKKSGYDIVWLDGGWQADQPRDAQGRLTANAARFPSGIPSLVKYLHQRGLRAGIYTDAGTYDGGKTCGLGSRGHYDQDARQFADWKIDAIKVDFLCGISEKADPGPSFKQFSDAVAGSGRRMLLNLCNPLTDDWGLPHTPAQDAHNAYVYGPTTGDSWRTGTDLAWGDARPGQWPNILRSLDANSAHPEAQGPGHYNDPDYLIPMRSIAGGGYELTEEESTTQLVLWAEMGSPLVIGSDPRTLPDSMLDTLRNPEILAVDQDPLDIQGVSVADGVYSKVLTGSGRRAVALLNRSDQAVEKTVSFADAGLRGPVSVRDLRARTDRGSHTGSYTVDVPAHGTAFLTLTGQDAAPGAVLPGRASASPAVVSAEGRTSSFLRGTDGALRQVSAHRTTVLGGPTGGRMLGQPAAYASAGGRIDVFVRGTDSTAYRRSYVNGRWGRWEKLGGTLTDAPSVAFTGPGEWTLFARGESGQVVSIGSDSGQSSLGAPGDRPVYGRPSAVTDSAGRTHVVVRTADDSLWTRTRSASGDWSDWTSLGGTVSGSPTLVASGGIVRLFALGSDYTLWQRDYDLTGADGAGAWGGWSKREEFPSGAVDGALGASAGPGDQVLAVFRGADGRVHLTSLRPSRTTEK